LDEGRAIVYGLRSSFMDVGGILGLILLTVLMDIEMRLPFYLASLAILGNALLYLVALGYASVDPTHSPSTRATHPNRSHDISPLNKEMKTHDKPNQLRTISRASGTICSPFHSRATFIEIVVTLLEPGFNGSFLERYGIFYRSTLPFWLDWHYGSFLHDP